MLLLGRHARNPKEQYDWLIVGCVRGRSSQNDSRRKEGKAQDKNEWELRGKTGKTGGLIGKISACVCMRQREAVVVIIVAKGEQSVA